MGVLGVLATLGAGCTTDEKYRELPPIAVEPVTAYGLSLDEHAEPGQVAFVLLRSLADDVKAAQAHDRDQQKAALRTTHALLAYSTIEKRLGQAERLTGLARKDEPGEREKKMYDFARQLAPIVAHYVASFDADYATASRKMDVRRTSSEIAHVYYEAAHDPEASDPSERDAVVIDIELAREPANGKSYWRVARVDFAGRPGQGPLTRPSTVPAAPVAPALPTTRPTTAPPAGG